MGVGELEKAESLESFGDADLNRLRKSVRNALDPMSTIYVVYVTTYAEKPESAGVVLHRDTIFIFNDTLLSLSEDVETRERMELSTLKHEWGHLLGLNHTISPDCVMSERVKVYDQPPIGWIVPIEHCEETLLELENIKQSFD